MSAKKLHACISAVAIIVASSASAQAAGSGNVLADIGRFADTADGFAANGFQSSEIETMWRVTTSLTAQIDGVVAAGQAGDQALCNNEVIEGLTEVREGLRRLRDGSLADAGFLIIVTGLRQAAQSCGQQ